MTHTVPFNRSITAQNKTKKQELLFRPDVEALAKQHPGIMDAQFICTKDPAWSGRRARVDAPLLWSLVPADGTYGWLLSQKKRGEALIILYPIHMHAAAERTLVYVCGPASMIDDVERVYTKETGPDGRTALRKEQVRFERWW